MGFELHRLRENAHQGDATPADGSDAGGHGDGDSPSADDDAGAGSAPDFDGGSHVGPSSDGGMSADAGSQPVVDGGSVDPQADSGTLIDDAGTPAPDAGQMLVEPFPLPTSIDCSSYAGTVSCANFDSELLGSGFSLYEEGTGKISIAQGYATGSATDPDAIAIVEDLFSAHTSGNIYMRFSMYIPSSVNITGLNVASIGNPETSNDFGLDLDLVNDGEVQVYVSGTDSDITGATGKIPRDRWMCVLWKVEGISDGSGTVRVLIDNTEVLSRSNVDTSPPGGVVGVSLGVDWTYNAQKNAKLYVDNLLITTQHPGNCP
jgi:hypothetical protein